MFSAKAMTTTGAGLFLLLTVAIILTAPNPNFAKGFAQSGYKNYNNPSFYAGMPNDSFRQTDSIPGETFFSYVVGHRGYAGMVFTTFHFTNVTNKLVPGYRSFKVQQPSDGPRYNALAYENGALVPTVGGLPSRSEMVSGDQLTTVYLFNPKGVALPGDGSSR